MSQTVVVLVLQVTKFVNALLNEKQRRQVAIWGIFYKDDIQVLKG